MKKSEFSARYYKRTFTETSGTTATGTGANDTYTITVSNGNRKLLPDANVKYIIFNLLAVVTCPYATEHCKALCYARKAENNYPDCKPCRDRNLKATKTAGFIPNIIDLIEYMIKLPSYRNGKKIVIRIHESGDFYSQEYFNKWLAIARHFESNKKLVFVAYTKSVNFIHDIPANMVVRYSIWDDTEPAQIAIANSLGLPVYTAVEHFTTETKRQQCDCINCSTCFKCFNNKFNLLKCEIH